MLQANCLLLGYAIVALAYLRRRTAFRTPRVLRLPARAPPPERLTPWPVDGGHRFALLSVVSVTACGITQPGRAMCWGSGNFGSLGNGYTIDSFVPVFVVNPPRGG